MIRVKVPATSANLGPGFDALGVALTMYNEVEMGPSDRLDIASLDGTPVPQGPDNLVYQSAVRLFEMCGREISGLKLRQINAIPMTRGLGSSSACIVAGLLGANAMLGEPVGKQDLLNLAAAIEGHPDNIAPALLGGLVTSVMEHHQVSSISVPVSPNVRFAVMVPNFPMKTEFARSLLPASVSRQDAVFNLSRTALMTAALFSGELRHLKVAVEDRLHQPYRLPAIRGGKEAFEVAYELGAYGVYLSGAGPTIMAVIDYDLHQFAQKAQQKLQERGIMGWNVQVLECEQEGAQVTVEP